MTETERTTHQKQEFESVLTQSSADVASFDSNEKSTLERIRHYLHSSPAAVPLIVLVLSLAAFAAIVGGRFFTPFALTLILQQVAIVGIVGAAQTLVILTAGIDLSVGAIMVLTSVVMGQFTFRYGLPVEVAVACGLALGALCGFVNGVLVAHIKLPPFIVTLGTWQIFLAATYIYSANETIRAQEIEQQAPLLQFFGQKLSFGGATFTYGVFAMIVLIAILWYVLNYTAWGRHLYAIGDDPEAAQLSGVRTKRVLVSVYVLAGLICALAGWAQIGRNGSVSPQVGQFANIESITAVVIGGMSLFGGRGSIMGMLFGALIVGVFSFGMRMIGTDVQWTYLIIGLLIISAVAIDQWIRKAAS
ncbi:ABC transporter permease [Phyllobacterium sp. 21LDTY02-6]|uniref:ABC transporter permease n=1 Tax=unclassified Phyllobacterium TaxID=2638441 RepID=UPI0020226E7D|nr:MULTISPECIES: ABC transporter permease [unclassified Phyllobacterium]MCO4317833.1 ABC transporter permease [Phyllobacterium sp. 21LDTY02-6]MCX8282015.1 ABC transporter permease [Phyllobacterium sp. 0TCS1.6C]MCX8296293.1 ABC transporter permease [Phyllobacterium sp. 0TCS1.6A]